VEDDLVEVIVVQRLLDGIHRVVPLGDRPVHRGTGRLCDQRQREGQDLLSLRDVRMQRLRRAPATEAGVGDEQMEAGRTACSPLLDRVM
jgi:hypothetical protein